mmetsp:Transcript_19633/g.52971  ORF Transcript_19633/g.52971 Transcript_19633/m.52971 type:complete len:212 (+) Transcript_19633:756-1391(+)
MHAANGCALRVEGALAVGRRGIAGFDLVAEELDVAEDGFLRDEQAAWVALEELCEDVAQTVQRSNLLVHDVAHVELPGALHVGSHARHGAEDDTQRYHENARERVLGHLRVGCAHDGLKGGEHEREGGEAEDAHGRQDHAGAQDGRCLGRSCVTLLLKMEAQAIPQLLNAQVILAEQRGLSWRGRGHVRRCNCVHRHLLRGCGSRALGTPC